MLRRAVAVAGIIWGFASAAPTLGQVEIPILVSGQEAGLIINANRNNQLGDEGDCIFRFRTLGGNLRIDATQSESSQNLLRACTGDCFGNGFVSSDFAEASVEECDWESPPTEPSVPVVLGVASNTSETNSTSNSTSPGLAAGIGPVEVNRGRLSYPADFEQFFGGEGLLCDANGPVAQVVVREGMKVIVAIKRFNGPGNYSCVNLPFELEEDGIENFDACFPKNNQDNVDLALASDRNDPFLIIRLATLDPCVGRQTAPTMTETGLILLVVSLLGIGVYRLRQRNYATSLPLV